MPDEKNVIADEIVVGDRPGGNAVAPTPGTVSRIKTLADIEYVAGRKWDWYQSMPRGISWAFDDITQDFGTDIYDRMLLDPQVRSTVNVLKSAVLESGIVVRPRVEKQGQEGFAIAKQLAEDSERMLDDMESDLQAVLWNMLDAIGVGHKIAEQVFGLDSTFSGKQQYTLRSLDVKPRESLAFVVDPYYHIQGLLARIPGQAISVNQGIIAWDPSQTPNFMPRSKFAILTFRPNNNDPRGTSVLRSCWNPWNRKQAIQKEWLKYITQFASPSLIGFTPEGAQPYALVDASGNIVIDPVTNMPVMVKPEQAMVDALEAFANGSATAFPYGALVQVVEMTGEGEAFHSAYLHADREIAKAILGQTLATEEGAHQTRASSGTHKDILDMLVLQTKRPVERMIQRDILGTWLRLNGRAKDIALLPRVTLGSVEREDMSRMFGAMAALFSSGFIGTSQLAQLDEMLGLPQRDPADQVGVHILEQVQVKEQGSDVDLKPNELPTAKKITNPTATPPAAGDLAPHGGGAGGDGA